jgi:hypothetical protein
LHGVAQRQEGHGDSRIAHVRTRSMATGTRLGQRAASHLKASIPSHLCISSHLRGHGGCFRGHRGCFSGHRGCLLREVTRLLRDFAVSVYMCIYKHICIYGQAGEEDGR